MKRESSNERKKERNIEKIHKKYALKKRTNKNYDKEPPKKIMIATGAIQSNRERARHDF